MIDLNKIGERIKEQRKYILHVSQEKMAEDLLMYQADISNLEKAKPGSGIGDLLKLDPIADYLHIPLETLLFGREDKNMLHYHGAQMKLKESKKKITKGQEEILRKLNRGKETEEIENLVLFRYECGPYAIYSTVEQLMSMGEDSTLDENGIQNPGFTLSKLHTYVFLGPELIGVMLTDLTTVMNHVYQPHFDSLAMMIQPDILRVTDVRRTLNPYWALWRNTDEGPEKDIYRQKMCERMDALREAGENRPILYIESVYVREDCRQHGIFRLYIDFLKELFEGCLLWLNMEPTSGAEMDTEATNLSSYTIADLGQLNINAAIAEKVGFRVDPEAWPRPGETTDAEGNTTVDTVEIRKCAYYMPQRIRKLLRNDGELIAQGRALEKLKAAESGGQTTVDVSHNYVGEDYACEVKTTYPTGEVRFVTVIITRTGVWRGVISKTSLMRDKKQIILADYNSLEEIQNEQDRADLVSANIWLSTGYPDNYFDPSVFANREAEPEADFPAPAPRGTEESKQGYIGENCAYEIKTTLPSGEITYATVSVSRDCNWRGVITSTGFLGVDNPVILADYSMLFDIENPDHFNDLYLADTKLTEALPKDYLQLDAIEEWNMEKCPLEYPENFDIITDRSYTLQNSDGEPDCEILEVELKRTNTDKIGEILFALVAVFNNGDTYYAFNRKSLYNMTDEEAEDDIFKAADPVHSFDGDKELEGSKYKNIFETIREHM